uniref:electron transfer flavoprotein beta subunit lysine methyltransferase-like n=1 Tax=Gasterosteus aculeatus aculeatus TaxID=481459 RepID=UPI001A980B75|nr:electron transfer flavoprotein beta subunit lysine methyltransferase-like [Gasterosteus aculeatus aculeatus]
MLTPLTTVTRYIKAFVKAFGHTSAARCSSNSCRPDSKPSENTEVVGQRILTPEFKLRLFTLNCRFWTEMPELWPFDDPYWAIYWPGGQALSRYLLDNPAAITARPCGAAHVVANDIDLVAAVVTHMNCGLLEPPVCLTNNMIDSPPKSFDLILPGDMFYDEALATSLRGWLDNCIDSHGTKDPIGDPGRAQFEEHRIP